MGTSNRIEKGRLGRALVTLVALITAYGSADRLRGEEGIPSLAQTGTAETASATRPVQHVDLKGTILSKNPIVKIVAVDRLLADPLAVSKDVPQDPFVYPGTIDPKTGGGAFTIPKLLTGRKYDLIVWTKTAGELEPKATRWEGVSLDYHREVVPGAPVTEEDKTWLKDFVATEPQFANKARVLWMAADHQHATLLVELLRDTEFHSGASQEIIYRTELWYFENLYGGWAKDKNTERVLVRWRGDIGKFPQIWQYVPGLGGIEISPTGVVGTGNPLELKLPEEPDKKRGVVGGVVGGLGKK